MAGHGLSLVVVAALGALLDGPVAAVGFLAGTLVGGLVNMLVDFLLMRRPDPRLRQPLSSTERFFLDALRLHAARSGQPLDLERVPATATEEEGPGARRWPTTPPSTRSARGRASPGRPRAAAMTAPARRAEEKVPMPSRCT